MEQVQESNAPMEQRRLLFRDPEFPFWTNEPSRGHVILWNSRAYVVIDVHQDQDYVTNGWRVTGRELLADGSDNLNNKTFQFFAKIASLEWALIHLEFVQAELPCIENEVSIKNLGKSSAKNKV